MANSKGSSFIAAERDAKTRVDNAQMDGHNDRIELVSLLKKSSNSDGSSISSSSSISIQQTPATTKKPQKPRRRVATLAQRRAANIRERRRMFNLNAAFDRLRKKVPSFAYEKRLSRIETLKLAIMYIRFMDDLVNDDAYAEKYKQLTANTSTSSAVSGSFLKSTLSSYEQQHQQHQESISPYYSDTIQMYYGVEMDTTPTPSLGTQQHQQQQHSQSQSQAQQHKQLASGGGSSSRNNLNYAALSNTQLDSLEQHCHCVECQQLGCHQQPEQPSMGYPLQSLEAR